MVMMPQAMPELKRFLTPLGLRKHAEAMVIRLVAAFVLHVARMSAVQAAGAIKTEPCHRAQVCRCLGRKFWGKYRPLQTLQAAVLACETKAAAGCFFWTRHFTASRDKSPKTPTAPATTSGGPAKVVATASTSMRARVAIAS